MKKLLLVVIAVVSFATASFAQNSAPVWVTINTPNVRCFECKKRLDEYMAREVAQTQGAIIKMTVNMLAGTTRVQYWPDRTNLGYIKTAFANAGFDADDIKAAEDAYNKLPPQCKRNEEGGGPKKGKPCHLQPF